MDEKYGSNQQNTTTLAKDVIEEIDKVVIEGVDDTKIETEVCDQVVEDQSSYPWGMVDTKNFVKEEPSSLQVDHVDLDNWVLLTRDDFTKNVPSNFREKEDGGKEEEMFVDIMHDCSNFVQNALGVRLQKGEIIRELQAVLSMKKGQEIEYLHAKPIHVGHRLCQWRQGLISFPPKIKIYEVFNEPFFFLRYSNMSIIEMLMCIQIPMVLVIPKSEKLLSCKLYRTIDLKEVVFVEVPKPGSSMAQGSSFGAMESVKATSDVTPQYPANLLRLTHSLLNHLV
ncbi:hypothetical protein RHSIM_Rhsim07G0124200 [Rhododendron simsii]|uniref:Uncharacterized protein n=1 Tax=Rhododendron simsii TaxID=118357 RepID=A0A834LJH6_RHOSS|nr:hypothetical protein RHSIM_Rhsim07G0124200 [Rhododendron simsii]